MTVLDPPTDADVHDMAGLNETLAPDAELISPLSGRMRFRGPGDLGVLLGAVYSSLAELPWTDTVR